MGEVSSLLGSSAEGLLVVLGGFGRDNIGTLDDEADNFGEAFGCPGLSANEDESFFETGPTRGLLDGGVSEDELSIFPCPTKHLQLLPTLPRFLSTS